MPMPQMRHVTLIEAARLCVSLGFLIGLKRSHGKTVVFMDIHEQKEKKREHARDEGPWLFFISILLETPRCSQMLTDVPTCCQKLPNAKKLPRHLPTPDQPKTK